MGFVGTILGYLIGKVHERTLLKQPPVKRISTWPFFKKANDLLKWAGYEAFMPRSSRLGSQVKRYMTTTPVISLSRLLLSWVFCLAARIPGDCICERAIPGLPQPVRGLEGQLPDDIDLDSPEGVESFFTYFVGSMFLREKKGLEHEGRLVELDLRAVSSLEPEDGYVNLGCRATFKVQAGEKGDVLLLHSASRISGLRTLEETRETVTPLTCRVVVSSVILQAIVATRYADIRVPVENLLWNARCSGKKLERHSFLERDLSESTDFDVGTLDARVSLAFGLRASAVRRYMTSCAAVQAEESRTRGCPVAWDFDIMRSVIGPLRTPFLASLGAWWDDLSAIECLDERRLAFSNVVFEAASGGPLYALLFDKRMFLGLNANRFTRNAPFLGSHVQACAILRPAEGFPLLRDVYAEIGFGSAGKTCSPFMHPSTVRFGCGR